MALSPSNQNQLSTFSQQGNIDWVALGSSQYSASIAVIGRLVGAGIDRLTLAFGQVMCNAIPIGAHGEKLLQDSLSHLKAFSSFGDVIWFGVGVRHVLRDLVLTSQGCALVALCGALSEGYSIGISSLVLYEMAKLSSAPGDLRPSVSQWKALVKVSGSVFNQSTLGIRIAQSTKLSGNTLYSKSIAGHPGDIAHIIFAVGRVASGVDHAVRIQGGLDCAWIAAWADFVLHLRVRLHSADFQTTCVNYDDEAQQAQVDVEITEELSVSQSLQCVNRTSTVRSGKDIIYDFFGNPGGPARFMLHSGGRVKWDSMLQDTFDSDFLIIIDNCTHEPQLIPAALTSPSPDNASPDGLS